MKLPGGQPFSLAMDNRPVPGCTISSAVSDENGYCIYVFSLAADTDISPESYAYPKLWLAQEGDMTILLPDGEFPLRTGEGYVTPVDIPVGIRANEDSVFTEITLNKDFIPNRHSLPFFVWCISGSRCFSAFLVDGEALIMVASTTVPPLRI